MTDPLRDFAAREAQHEPHPRPALAMRRCPDCGRLRDVVGPAVHVCPPRPIVPLSDEAQAARLPLPPAVLVDARQDTIHRDIGEHRPARARRREG